jgi:Zn-dependent protease with chaperone function
VQTDKINPPFQPEHDPMSYDPYSNEPRQDRRSRNSWQGGPQDEEEQPYNGPRDPRFRRREEVEQEDEEQNSGYSRRGQTRLPQPGDPEEPEQGGGPFGQGGQDGQRPAGGGIGGGILQLLLRNPKVLIAIVMAIGAFISYQMLPSEKNPVTDETYKIPWEPKQDIALGLQARDQMMAQHGGEHPDRRLQAKIDEIGTRLVQANAKGDWADTFKQYEWDFHLLRDPETINAFALPGGQVFFTYGLYSKLQTEDEVAGVLGHEIGHVIGRHSAKQMAKQKLVTGVAGAGSVLMSDGRSNSGQMAQVIGAMVGMKYGREDESQSDRLGVQFMVNAGYNPDGLVGVMEVLSKAMGGNRQPEFMSTHPNPENRIENIKATIEAVRDGRLEGPKPTQNSYEKFR